VGDAGIGEGAGDVVDGGIAIAEEEGLHGVGGFGIDAEGVFKEFAAEEHAEVGEGGGEGGVGRGLEEADGAGLVGGDFEKDAVGGEVGAHVEGAGVGVGVGAVGPAIGFDELAAGERDGGLGFDADGAGGGDPAVVGLEFGDLADPEDVAVMLGGIFGRGEDAEAERDGGVIAILDEAGEVDGWDVVLMQLIESGAAGEDGEGEGEVGDEVLRGFAKSDFGGEPYGPGDGGEEEGDFGGE